MGPQPPHLPVATTDQTGLRVDGLRNCIKKLQAFDPRQGNIGEAEALEVSIDEALSAAFGRGSVNYLQCREAANLFSAQAALESKKNILQILLTVDPNTFEIKNSAYYLALGKQRSIKMLEAAILALELDFAVRQSNQESISIMKHSSKRKVFVVHGHDKGARETVARFLEKLDLEAIILSERPDQGRAIINKFEDEAADVGFAVVLLTPDDLVSATGEPVSETRARQNVLFELGYFAGKLGRGRTCLLRKGNVQIPSDLHGVIYTDLDDDGGWKLKLIGELKAAGIEVRTDWI